MTTTTSKDEMDKLLNEEPKIDAALKQYCSWIAAQGTTAATDASLTSSTTPTSNKEEQLPAWTLSEALKWTRKLSKAINQHIFPIHPPSKRTNKSKNNGHQLQLSDDQRDIVARIWNEHQALALTASSSNNNNGKKSTTHRITKMLGRTCLRHAWADLDLSEFPPVDADDDQGKSDESSSSVASSSTEHRMMGLDFLHRFEALLFAKPEVQTEYAHDAALIWSTDKGRAELSRRATKRIQDAKVRRGQETMSSAEVTAATILGHPSAQSETTIEEVVE